MLWQQMEQYSLEIILALGLLLIISISLQLLQWIKLKGIRGQYQRVTQGVDNKNLEELIVALSEQTKATNKQMAAIVSEQEQILAKLKTCVSTPELLKYNAFDDMGSNLSFSLSLLDEKHNGIILTNLQGRQEARLYIKSIVEGKSAQQLSTEEYAVLPTNKDPGL